MNANIKKEIRLLLPGFLFAAALAPANLLFHESAAAWHNVLWRVLGSMLCPAAVVMMALSTFGTEVGTRTFALMLAQPVSRQRLWQTKVSFLAVAMLIISAIWCGCVRADDNSTEMMMWFTMFNLVVFTGALWTVLLLRQVAAAFWITQLAPGALLLGVALCFSDTSDGLCEGMAAVVLGAYSLAGFFFARRLFFRAQDLQWTGGAIVMPEWRGLRRLSTSGGKLRQWRPVAALAWKEIQLHQSLYVLAFVLLVLHLGVLAVRAFADLHNSRDLKALLDGFWVLWLVIPLLAGCAAVAEERKLGTHESQLCLPVGRRTQFFIKLFVVLGLSVVFGMFVPLLLEPSAHSHGFPGWDDLALMAGGVSLIGGVSFYFSTLARNTLQIMGPAIAGIVLAFSLILIVREPLDLYFPFLWRGGLPYFILLPVLGLTMLALAAANFQQVLTGWKLAGRNMLTLAVAFLLGVAATSAVYHRFWDKLVPEPAHGAARWTLANPPSFGSRVSEWAAFSIRLPDGRICVFPFHLRPAAPLDHVFANFKLVPVPGEFLTGGNWLDVTGTYSTMAGVKSDGTLWISTASHPEKPLFKNRWEGGATALPQLVQLGAETNWTSMIAFWNGGLLVKNDGTLWRLTLPSAHPTNAASLGSAELKTLTPERLGTNSDWAKVIMTYGLGLLKKDGSAWVVGNWSTNHVASIRLSPEFTVYRAAALDRDQMRSTAWITHGVELGVGVRSDGTFRIWADQHLEGKQLKGSYYYRLRPADQPIGSGTNWLAVAGQRDNAVTLRADGTLWLWKFRYPPFLPWNPDRYFAGEVQRTVPVRLGTHSDWVAIGGSYSEGVLALAADGSVWFWPLDDVRNLAELIGFNRDGIHDESWLPLLDISRKPQLVGNVFSAAN